MSTTDQRLTTQRKIVDHTKLFQFTATCAAYGGIRISTTRKDSQLADLVFQLWEAGGLPEFARDVARHTEQLQREGQGLCHELAFSFLYGLLVNMDGDYKSPCCDKWRWRLGRRAVLNQHSWIEHQGEVLDVITVTDDQWRNPETVLSVWSQEEFYRMQGVTRTEARSLTDLGRFLAGEFKTFFPGDVHMSEYMKEARARLWRRGEVMVAARRAS